MSYYKQDALITFYQEVCSSYRVIADSRVKLLGLLPFPSGAGIFFLLGPDSLDESKQEIIKQFLTPISIFGFEVMLGLFFYESRDVQRSNWLIEVAKKLEEALEISGQLALKPPYVGNFIGSTVAAQVIYPVGLAAWMFVPFSPKQSVSLSATGIVFTIFFLRSHTLKLK